MPTFENYATATSSGDLNNTQAARAFVEFEPDLSYLGHTLAIPSSEDAKDIQRAYRPFILDDKVSSSDWVARLELSTAMKMVEEELQRTGGDRLKVLVLFGSLRSRSYSRLVAFEAARILFRLGCDVRVYDPTGLPVKGDIQHSHPKVQELRNLSKWSDGHIWVSPEQHGNLTAVFKNQIDWIPLSTGSVRPTQGRTLAIAQVSGGSQSFNTVNSLRVLGRWMRMFTIPNQSSIPKAYTQFTDETAEEGEADSCLAVIEIASLIAWKNRFSERNERMAARGKVEQQELEAAAATKHVSTITNGATRVNSVAINGV